MVSNMAGNSLLYEYRCCNVQLVPAAAPTPEAAAAAKKAEEEASKQTEEEAAKQKAASAAEEVPSTTSAVPGEAPAPSAPAETPGAAGPIVPGLLRVTVYKVDGFKKGLTSKNISPYVALQIGTDTQRTSWKENVR
jgi:hemolysin activation/secretion protein